MNKLNKNYLVIKNICSDKNLRQYLEQICHEENVSILHEEFNQFDIWNGKQSVYAEFDAKPSFDLLLWSYDENKLNYINYLYSDFEARYRNTGKVVSRIVENMDNGDNLDEGEKVDKVIRDNLSFGWMVQWGDNTDLGKKLELHLNELEQRDWIRADIPQKQSTFKQKVSNFYNKHAEKIMYLCIGIAIFDLFSIALLTIKYFMVK